MAYPVMSADVFQNANIAILTCQLFVMLLSIAVAITLSKKAVPQRVTQAALSGAKL